VTQCGKQDDGLADVSVYPNPVKNELMINIDADKTGTGTLLVTDFSGKVLYNHAIKLVKGNNKLPINTSSLAGGTYLLTLQLADDRIVKKFNKL
jgi:Secretion system C-terminal sorting domain